MRNITSNMEVVGQFTHLACTQPRGKQLRSHWAAFGIISLLLCVQPAFSLQTAYEEPYVAVVKGAIEEGYVLVVRIKHVPNSLKSISD